MIVMIGIMVLPNLLIENNIDNTEEHQEIIYPNIGLVDNIFTMTAYHAEPVNFYDFFACTPVCELSDKDYFISEVTHTGTNSFISPTIEYSLSNNFGYDDSKISIISDIAIHNNNLYYVNGTLKYDILVFYHNEYVTTQQYDNMMSYIENGGNVLIMNGNAFYAEISYNESNNTIQLVDGHSWKFNGDNATRSNYYHFFDRNTEQIGSVFCNFRNGNFHAGYTNDNQHPISKKLRDNNMDAIGSRYVVHEDNCVNNDNVDVIIDWEGDFDQKYDGIKTYEFIPFENGGSIIHLGIFATDMLTLLSITPGETVTYGNMTITYNDEYIENHYQPSESHSELMKLINYVFLHQTGQLF